MSVAGGECRLQHIGTVSPAERLGAREPGEAAADRQLVAANAVLLRRRNERTEGTAIRLSSSSDKLGQRLTLLQRPAGQQKRAGSGH